MYSNFVEDYNNPNLTTVDVQRLNSLNSKQYCKLRRIAIENNDIPETRHMNTTNAKFYITNNKGECIVRKTTNNQTIVVGRFPNSTIANMIVEECKKVNWNINEIRDIIDEHKIKPKNYSLVNGYYVVQKMINKKRIIYCKVKQKNHAKIIVKELEKHNWDKKQVPIILENLHLN